MTEISPTRLARRDATAQKVLRAARDEFGSNGFNGTTIRGIAAKAGVNSSLVHQHYGTKNDLFSAALGLSGEVHDDAASHLGDVIAMKFGELSPETLVLLRSMLTSSEANREISAFMDARIDARTGSIGGPDARARAVLAASSAFGLAILRHFLTMPTIASIDSAELMNTAYPWFAWLTKP